MPAARGGTPSTPGLKWQTQRPEPGRAWVRYVPRPWSAPACPWVDVAHGALGTPSTVVEELPAAPSVVSLDPLSFDDAVYLPPVAPEQRSARDAWLNALRVAGSPVVLQLLPGEPLPESLRSAGSEGDLLSGTRGDELSGEAGVLVLVDLLPLLLDSTSLDLPGRLRATLTAALTAEASTGATVLWPLLPGLTDGPDLWRAAALPLRDSGAAHLLPQVVELTPSDRRQLAEQHPAAYDALFHRRLDATAERAFAASVRAALAGSAGPQPLPPRPLPAGPPRLRRNRWLSGELIRIAELWLRLGRAVGRGDACFRAARWVDSSALDVAALVNEGNLDIIEPIDAASRALLEELVREGHCGLLDELLRQYLSPPEER